MSAQVDFAVRPDAVVSRTPPPDLFDLDVRFAESGPALAVLVRVTGDNCGATCESACVSCP